MKKFRIVRKTWLSVGLCLTLVLVSAGPASAETERVLIPIFVGGVPGAYGSVWSSKLWAHNLSSAQKEFDGDFVCSTNDCFPRTIGSVTIGGVPMYLQRGSDPGLFIHVGKPAVDVAFNLTVYDESRIHLTKGTEIRVVRESEALSGKSVLLNVPSSSRFRVRVRFYDFDGRSDARFLVNAYRTPQGPDYGSMGKVEVALTPPDPSARDRRYKPGYGQIDDVMISFPGAAIVQDFVLEITPLTEGLRYWVFATVTHNETQFVTTINPR